MGDPDQYLPVVTSWRGEEAAPLLGSDLLYSMAGGTTIKLTVNRRSDPEIFGFLDRIVEETPIAELVKQAQAQFSFEGPADWELAISHAKRRKICLANNARQRAAYTGEVLTIPTADVQGDREQTIDLFPGVMLQARVRLSKDGFVNGSFHEVVSTNPLQVKDVDDEQTREVDPAWATEHLFLASCVTQSSVQGRTLRGRVRVHDCGHRHFTHRSLRVCLSRAQHHACLDLRE